MFAVIKTGGKQYNVVSNDLIRVEKLPGKVGDTIELKEVLLVGEDTNIAIGMPIVEGAFIIAKIVEQERASKVIAFKKRRRKNSKRIHGHRQNLTVLQISDIVGYASETELGVGK
ncbi:MAG: large subunit ribosomal protein L21 [Candidatus Tokpelaia sp. JSC085]|nr:MAG: large subunit ribosomal protein L21 [Candidatus Tokpelaia sp. JSC085]